MKYMQSKRTHESTSGVRSQTWIASIVTLTALISVSSAEETNVDDQFQTVALTSEVELAGNLLVTRRRTESVLGHVARNAITRSCSCLRVSDGSSIIGGSQDQDSDFLSFVEPYVELQIKSGSALVSQRQSASIKKHNTVYQFKWDSRILPDIHCDQSVIYVDSAQHSSELLPIPLTLTYRSRKAFDKLDEPKLETDPEFVSNIQRKSRETLSDEFGLNLMRDSIVLMVKPRVKRSSEKTMIKITHPAFIGNDPKCNVSHGSLDLPILFENSYIKPTIVNFGFVGLGKEKQRSIAHLELSDAACVELGNKLTPPFKLEVSKRGCELKFCPAKTGKFKQLFSYQNDNGMPAELHLKGACYSKKVSSVSK